MASGYNSLRKPVFKDVEKEEFFNKYGFNIIRNFISQDVVEQIKTKFDEVYTLNPSQNQWNSQYNLFYERATEFSSFIRDLIYPSFEKHFEYFDIPMASVMAKNPIKHSTCELHRDFTVFDEKSIQHRNFWIPLVDVHHGNGALYAIPGTHRLFSEIRPMFSPWPYEYMKEQLLLYKIDFIVQPGDLVLYADRTLHGSYENTTSLARPVIHGGILPEDYQIYFYKDVNGKITKYEVNTDFFMTGDFMDESKMSKYKIVDCFKYLPTPIRFEEIQGMISKFYNEIVDCF